MNLYYNLEATRREQIISKAYESESHVFIAMNLITAHQNAFI